MDGNHDQIVQTRERLEKLLTIKGKFLRLKILKDSHIFKNTNNAVIIKKLRKKKKKINIIGFQHQLNMITNLSQMGNIYLGKLYKWAGHQLTSHLNLKLVYYFDGGGDIKFFKNRFPTRPDKFDLEDLDRPFRVEELELAMMKSNTAATPGPDGLDVSFYKILVDDIKFLLVDCFNLLGSGNLSSVIVSDWNRANVVLIPKAKCENKVYIKCKEVRPIALMNEDCKILSRIILNRLRASLDVIINSSAAAIKGRGIGQALWMHHLAFHESSNIKSNNMLLRLDFKSAFCHVNTNYLQYLVFKYLGNNLTTRSLLHLVINKQLGIYLEGNHNNYRAIQGSLMQGSPLSTDLFNLYINELLFKIQRGIRGIKIQSNNFCLKTASYVDDLSIFLKDKEDLKVVMEIVTKFTMLTGSKINYKKSYLQSLKNGRLIKHSLFGGKLDKILGIFFSVDNVAKDRADIYIKLEELKEIIREWKWVDVSMLEKAAILNKLILSKIVYMMPFVKVTYKWINQVKIMCQKFIFKKVRFLSKEKSSYPIQKGGLGLLDIKALSTSVKARNYYNFFIKENAVFQKLFQVDFITKDSVIKQAQDAFRSCMGLQEKNVKITHRQVLKLQLAGNDEFINYKNNCVNLKLVTKYKFSYKLQDFLTKCFLGCLPTAEWLEKRHIIQSQDINCIVCNKHSEDMIHIFKECLQAREVNVWMKNKMNSIMCVWNDKDWWSYEYYCQIPDNVKKWLTCVLFGIWKFRCQERFNDKVNKKSLIFHVNNEIMIEFLKDLRSFAMNSIFSYWNYNLIHDHPIVRIFF